MKVHVLRNIGAQDLRKLGATDRTDLVEDAMVDVPTNLGNTLVERKLAELPKMNAQAKAPEISGVADDDESPVDNMTVPEATDKISRMVSKEKLQHIADNDKRSSVVSAAKNRLAAL